VSWSCFLFSVSQIGRDRAPKQQRQHAGAGEGYPHKLRDSRELGAANLGFSAACHVPVSRFLIRYLYFTTLRATAKQIRLIRCIPEQEKSSQAKKRVQVIRRVRKGKKPEIFTSPGLVGVPTILQFPISKINNMSTPTKNFSRNFDT